MSRIRVGCWLKTKLHWCKNWAHVPKSLEYLAGKGMKGSLDCGAGLVGWSAAGSWWEESAGGISWSFTAVNWFPSCATLEVSRCRCSIIWSRADSCWFTMAAWLESARFKPSDSAGSILARWFCYGFVKESQDLDAESNKGKSLFNKVHNKKHPCGENWKNTETTKNTKAKNGESNKWTTENHPKGKTRLTITARTQNDRDYKTHWRNT